jgi:hypothetical protein
MLLIVESVIVVFTAPSRKDMAAAGDSVEAKGN